MFPVMMVCFWGCKDMHEAERAQFQSVTD